MDQRVRDYDLQRSLAISARLCLSVSVWMPLSISLHPSIRPPYIFQSSSTSMHPYNHLSVRTNQSTTSTYSPNSYPPSFQHSFLLASFLPSHIPVFLPSFLPSFHHLLSLLPLFFNSFLPAFHAWMHACIHASIHPSTQPSTHPSIHPSANPPIDEYFTRPLSDVDSTFPQPRVNACSINHCNRGKCPS